MTETVLKMKQQRKCGSKEKTIGKFHNLIIKKIKISKQASKPEKHQKHAQKKGPSSTEETKDHFLSVTATIRMTMIMFPVSESKLPVLQSQGQRTQPCRQLWEGMMMCGHHLCAASPALRLAYSGLGRLDTSSRASL